MEGEEQELESDIKEGIWQVVEEKQRKILTEIEDQEKRDSLNREKELRNRDEADLEEELRRSREEQLRKANLGTDIDYPYGRPSETRIPTSSAEQKFPYRIFDRNPLAQKSFFTRPPYQPPRTHDRDNLQTSFHQQRQKREQAGNKGIYQDSTGYLYAEASGEYYTYAMGFPPKNPSHMRGEWRLTDEEPS